MPTCLGDAHDPVRRPAYVAAKERTDHQHQLRLRQTGYSGQWDVAESPVCGRLPFTGRLVLHLGDAVSDIVVRRLFRADSPVPEGE
jgi:hypothetical protein